MTSDEEVLMGAAGGVSSEDEDEDIRLDMCLVYDFAMTSPLDELRFILATKEYNMGLPARPSRVTTVTISARPSTDR